MRRSFFPTVWDWTLLAGSLGFFMLMFLIFCRVIPAVSMHETKELVHEEKETDGK
jgi:molybdopterin-containing oxidoreductase family membrane subunit